MNSLKPKSLIQSKTFWANVLFLLGAACFVLLPTLGAEPSQRVREFVRVAPEFLALFVPVANILIRLMTGKPIAGTPEVTLQAEALHHALTLERDTAIIEAAESGKESR